MRALGSICSQHCKYFLHLVVTFARKGTCNISRLIEKSVANLLSTFYNFVYGKSKKKGKKRERSAIEICPTNNCRSLQGLPTHCQC